MTWNIVFDSSCDLHARQQGDLCRSSVPFIIRVGQQDFVDDETLAVPELVEAMEAEKTASHTACPSPEAWLTAFGAAEQVIALTISSQLSGSMTSALAAREMALAQDPTRHIAVVDSRSTGPELVLGVEELETLIRRGAGFDDVVHHAQKFFQRTQIQFALCSFDHLVKSGRVHRLAGFLAKALGMWGLGRGSDEGTIVLEGKVRGAKRAVRALLDGMEAKGFRGEKAAISHCDNLTLAQALKRAIQARWKNAEVQILPTRGLCSYYAERGGLIVSS